MSKALNNAIKLNDMVSVTDFGAVMWMCTAAGTPGTWTPIAQNGPLNTIAGTPEFVGALALSGGQMYIAVGTSSSDDWKQIT